MLRRWGLVLVGIAGAVAAAHRAGAQEKLRAPADRVEVSIDFEAPVLVDRVREAVVAAIPLYEKELGAKLPPSERLVIHLFRTPEAYTEAITKAGAGALAMNRAGTANKTRESYVMVQPSSEPEFLGVVDHLPEMTRCLVLHEAVHQFALRAGLFPNWYLPDWYTEGQANWLADLAVRAGRPKSSPPTLYFARYPHDLADAEREKRLPSLDSLFSKGFESVPDDQSLVYGASWALYGFLADPANAAWSKKLAAFREELRRRGRPAEDTAAAPVIAEIDRLFRKCVSEPKALEKAWKKPAPSSEWHAVWPASEIRGEEIVCATPPGRQNSLLVRTTPLAGPDFTLSGELILLAGGKQQIDVTFWSTRSPELYVKLAVGASGYLTVMGWRNDTWTTFGSRSGSPLTLGGDEWHPFEVTVKGTSVKAKVGDRTVDVTIPEGWIRGKGRWGIGTFQSIARFRKLEAR